MITLSRENIAPRIITIISDELGVKMADITEHDSICSDLGADSLDYVGLWMRCEDEFGVELGEEETKEVETVKELIDLVEAAGPTA